MAGKNGILFLACLLLFLTGCIGEDRSDCLYQLTFAYYGDGNTDIFDSKIQNVYVYVFDEEGVYVDKYIVSKANIDASKSFLLNIDPGRYNVVCWGNVTDWSVIDEEMSMLQDRSLYSSFYIDGSPIANFDSLYYGMRTIVVPENVNKTDTVYFRSSHINMEVYIDGLSTATNENRAVNDPRGWIAVRNTYIGYDFYMQTKEEVATVYPDMQTNTEDNTLYTKFNLFRFRDDNDIVIDIYNGSGQRVYSLNLADFLARNNITVEGINEITVPIYIQFKDTNVYISVDKWEVEPVDPIV